MSPQEEYNARIVATGQNLRRYYNECLELMGKETLGEMDHEQALAEMLVLDGIYAKLFVDDLAPLTHLIQVPKK